EQDPDTSSAEMALDDPQEVRRHLRELQERLNSVQDRQARVYAQVDSQAIAQAVADWTGIPVGKMLGDEVSAILNLPEQLDQRVVGQPQAMDAIARNIRSSRAGLAEIGRASCRERGMIPALVL